MNLEFKASKIFHENLTPVKIFSDNRSDDLHYKKC